MGIHLVNNDFSLFLFMSRVRFLPHEAAMPVPFWGTKVTSPVAWWVSCAKAENMDTCFYVPLLLISSGVPIKRPPAKIFQISFHICGKSLGKVLSSFKHPFPVVTWQYPHAQSRLWSPDLNPTQHRRWMPSHTGELIGGLHAFGGKVQLINSLIYKYVCRKLQGWTCSAWTWRRGPGLDCKPSTLFQSSCNF